MGREYQMAGMLAQESQIILEISFYSHLKCH